MSIVFKNWLYRRINNENNHILFLLFQQNSRSPHPYTPKKINFTKEINKSIYNISIIKATVSNLSTKEE